MRAIRRETEILIRYRNNKVTDKKKLKNNVQFGVQERIQKKLIFREKSNGEQDQTFLSVPTVNSVDPIKEFELYPTDSG